MQRLQEHLLSLGLSNPCSGDDDEEEGPRAEFALTNLLVPAFFLHGVSTVHVAMSDVGSVKHINQGLLLTQALRQCPTVPVVTVVEATRPQLQRLKSNADKLYEERREALRALKQARADLAVVEAERGTLQRQLSLATTQTAVERCERDYRCAQLEWQALQLRDQVRTLQVQLFALEQANADLRVQQRRDHAAHVDLVNERTVELAKKTAELDRLQGDLQRATSDITQERSKRGDLAEQLATTHTQVEALRAQLARAQDAESRLRNSPTKAVQAQEIASLRAHLDAAKATEATLGQLLQRQEGKLDKFDEMVGSLQERIRELQAENTRLAQQKESATNSSNNGLNQELATRLALLEADRRRDREEMLRELKSHMQQQSQPAPTVVYVPHQFDPMQNAFHSQQPPARTLFSDKPMSKAPADKKTSSMVVTAPVVDAPPKPQARKAPITKTSGASYSGGASSTGSASNGATSNSATSNNTAPTVDDNAKRGKRKSLKPDDATFDVDDHQEAEMEAVSEPVHKKAKKPVESAATSSVSLMHSQVPSVVLPLTSKPAMPPPSPTKQRPKSLLERADPTAASTFVPLHGPSNKNGGVAAKPAAGDGALLSQLFKRNHGGNDASRVRIPDRPGPMTADLKLRSHSSLLAAKAEAENGPSALENVVRNLTIDQSQLKKK